MNNDHYRRRNEYKRMKRRKPYETLEQQVARESRQQRTFVSGSKGIGVVVFFLIFLGIADVSPALMANKEIAFAVWTAIGIFVLGVISVVLGFIYDFFTT